MPSPQSIPLASTLVARFLRSNNYTQTLEAFIREAGLPVDAGLTGTRTSTGSQDDDDGDEWTIESILEEKRAFDLSLRFERYGGDEREGGWRVPAPSKPTILPIPAPSNILFASVEPWQRLNRQSQSQSQSQDTGPGPEPEPRPDSYIVATGADRQIHLLHTTIHMNDGHEDEDEDVVSLSGLSESPILSLVSVYRGKYVFMSNMSGQLFLVRGSRVLDRRRDHAKFVVRVVAYEHGHHHGPGVGGGPSRKKLWIATAGWDGKILIYCLDAFPETESESGSGSGSENGNEDIGFTIGSPIASINLPTNPESMLFTTHPDSGKLILIVSRRDSTYLYYYQVEPEPEQSPPSPDPTLSHSQAQAQEQEQEQEQEREQEQKPYECKLLGKQNLAPHSVAWVTFSPSCLAISPHDPCLIAVATSTVPHMKVIIVRLLFPFDDETTTTIPEQQQQHHQQQQQQETHLSQALASLSLQNREDAAILIQINTFAPQTAYSTPQVVWRPDGSGVWVNGDDGVIRGIETKTGKVVALLKDGHQGGCKVRTIWAGFVEGRTDTTVSDGTGAGTGTGTGTRREEWVVSGGFDKRLVVWRV